MSNNWLNFLQLLYCQSGRTVLFILVNEINVNKCILQIVEELMYIYYVCLNILIKVL